MVFLKLKNIYCVQDKILHQQHSIYMLLLFNGFYLFLHHNHLFHPSSYQTNLHNNVPIKTHYNLQSFFPFLNFSFLTSLNMLQVWIQLFIIFLLFSNVFFLKLVLPLFYLVLFFLLFPLCLHQILLMIFLLKLIFQ